MPVPQRRPRLYALGLEDDGGALHGWQDGLSRRLEEARLYEPEKRPFWPHVTLARVKRGARAPGDRHPGLAGGAAATVPRDPRDAVQVDAEAERGRVRAARDR